MYIGISYAHAICVSYRILILYTLYYTHILGTPQKIGQYALIGVLLLTRARFFLQVHAVAYLISNVNYEFAKAQGLF